jgi:hypothetical protein
MIFLPKLAIFFRAGFSYTRTLLFQLKILAPVVKMKSDPDKLLKKHKKLVHSEMLKVTSHVQRQVDDWILNTIMVEGYDVPFKYKRQKTYKNIKGARVNLTYYPDVEVVAGMEFEVMNVVRIKIA